MTIRQTAGSTSGETRQGYTRYGAWYGNDYGDWDAMFAAFCLYYAGVGSDVMPYDSGSYAWTVELNDAGLYADVASYIPAPGDLVFFDDDQDGRADRVAIVEEPVVETDEDAGTMTLTALYVIEGNCEDAVEENEYELSEVTILGYGLMPDQDGNVNGEFIGDAIYADEFGGDPAGGVMYMENSTLATNGIMPLDDEHDNYPGDHDGDIEITHVESTYGEGNDGAVYNPDTDKYEAHFRIEFTVQSDDLEYDEETGYYDECEFYLPDGVSVPERYQSGKYSGYKVGSDEEAFLFWFVEEEQADGTTKWKVVIQFEEGFFDVGSEDCYIGFDVYIDADQMDDGGELKLEFDDDYTVYVPVDSNQNETSGGDVKVTKTDQGGYDEDSSSITYVIEITSSKGTADSVIITDVLDLTTFDLLDGTSSIELGSVTYTTDVLNADGNPTGETTTTTINGCRLNVSINDDGTYSITITDASGNGLPAMAAGSKYTITYTVYLAPLADDWTGSANANNGVTVTSKDTWKHDLKDETSHDVGVQWSREWVTKSGSAVQNADGSYTITWTITVNTGNHPGDIAGMVLTDDAFAELEKSGFTITKSNGQTAVEGVDYRFIMDEETNTIIVGIEFLGTDDETDDNGETVTVNRNSYTITYAQDVIVGEPTLGNSSSVENEVELGEHETTGTVGLPGGSLAKAFEGHSDNGDGTQNISWKVTITVPKGGITSGTLIEDYLGSYDNDKSLYEWSDPTQWYTSDQIKDLFEDLYTNGMTFTNSEGETVKIYDSETGIETTLKYGDGNGYTIQVYDWTIKGWVSLESIMSGSYSGDRFVAWQLTFNKSVTLSEEGEIVLDFESTTDNEERHYNSIWIGELNKTVHDDYTEKVTKSDGSGNLGSSEVTVDDDGILTWVVTVHIPFDQNGTYVVTDSLPENTTLEQINISGGYIGDTVMISRNDDGTYTVHTYWSQGDYGTNSEREFIVSVKVVDANGDEVSADQAYDENGDLKDETYHQEITITLPPDEVERLATDSNYAYSDGGNFTLTFKVKISDESLEKLKEAFEQGTATVESYLNSVTVTYNEDEYGGATQNEDVTYGKEEDLEVSKMMSADDDTKARHMNATVLLNPEAEDLLTTGTTDMLDFTDTLTVQGGAAGVYVNLDPTSVHFYEVIEVTPSTDVDEETGYGTYWYLDENGDRIEIKWYGDGDSRTTGRLYFSEHGRAYLVGDELDVNWTYSSSGNTYTITAKVPDSTAILVEYTYDYYWLYGMNPTDVTVSNSAKLHGDIDYSGSKSDNEHLGDTSIEGGVVNGGQISIWKVDTNSYGELLRNADFALYMWDSTVENGDGTTGAWVAVTDSNGQAVVFTSDENGSVVISEETLKELGVSLQYNTAYYLVETNAPAGYIRGDKIVYFYWSNSDTTAYPPSYPDDTFTNYGGTWNATDLNNYDYEYFWTNNSAPSEQVGVEKLWKYTDESGNLQDEPNISNLWANVQLYYYLSSEAPEGWTGSLPTLEEPTPNQPDSGGGTPSESENAINVYYVVNYNASLGEDQFTFLGSYEKGSAMTITFSSSSQFDVYIKYVNNNDGSAENVLGWSTGGSGENVVAEIGENQANADLYIYLDNSNVTITIEGTEYVKPDDPGDTGGTEDPDTSEGPGPEESTVILEYGPYKDAEGNTYIFRLDESNDWKASVGDLPEYWFDEDGNLWWYYYYFVEVDVSEGWSTSNATYDPTSPTFVYDATSGTYTLVSGNGVDGIGTDVSTVTVTNITTDNPSYELPSAGGPGTGILIAAGLACAGGAGVLLIRNVHHSRVPYRKRRGRP